MKKFILKWWDKFVEYFILQYLKVHIEDLLDKPMGIPVSKFQWQQQWLRGYKVLFGRRYCQRIYSVDKIPYHYMCKCTVNFKLDTTTFQITTN